MFNSPCLNHKDGNCPLDLKALYVAITTGSDPKAWERYQAAQVNLNKLTAEKAPEAVIKAARADYDKAWREYTDSNFERSAKGQTIIYSLRAHHRGRLHGTKRRLPDGTKIVWTKVLQEAFLQDPGAQRLLSKFLKKPEVKPQQNVA